MSLFHPASDGEENPFWESFETVIPEAVRCRFFSTAREAAVGRAIEFGRESGPFLCAIEEMHLPVVLLRNRLLAKVAEAITGFWSETDGLISDTTAPLFEVTRIVAAFQENIVVPLQNALETRDEEQARLLIPRLRDRAVEIARLAEQYFEAAVRELELRVAKSVIHSESFKHSVSVVSLDMAQYGKHARVVSSYAEAVGVHSLNKKIRQKIDESLNPVTSIDDVLLINTGDGALMIFHTAADQPEVHAERAVQFSENFLKLIHQSNAGIDPAQQLHFRVGVCSGIIAGHHQRVRRTEITHCDAGGLPLGTAVRLQAAARTGEILASASTWNQLAQSVRGKFSAEVSVFGKTHERNSLPAHRYQCVPPIADESS